MSLELNEVITLSALTNEEMMFGMLSTMPISTITSIVTIVLIAVFFITSADSATFVLGMHSTNGSNNPPNGIKFVWGWYSQLQQLPFFIAGVYKPYRM
ncbi:glycine betaine transporter OpuD [Geomicrobium sp. JCM 19055]|nr:glycine betaine transporter OpuD [Geomicrobium sp. JCM 19055]